MRVERIKLDAGQTWTCPEHLDTYIHPLIGKARVGEERIGGRRRVFDAFPGGLLATQPTVHAETDFDFIVYLGFGSSKDGRRPQRVSAKVHMIGDGTARREVREILGSEAPTRALRCGETVNKPGGWSSWPPHHFDKTTTEGFEEVFYVFTDPKDSYALIPRKGTIKGEPVGDVYVAHSGDRVEIPLGIHPIVAAPGTRLIYCWFYVGATKEYARWSEDLGNYK